MRKGSFLGLMAITFGLLAALPASAGPKECNYIRIKELKNCEVVLSGTCTASCDELGIYDTACATKLQTVCGDQCTLSANPTCTDGCTTQCQTDCDAGINVICSHNCFAECTTTRDTDRASRARSGATSSATPWASRTSSRGRVPPSLWRSAPRGRTGSPPARGATTGP